MLSNNFQGLLNRLDVLDDVSFYSKNLTNGVKSKASKCKEKISQSIKTIKSDPKSYRAVVSAVVPYTAGMALFIYGLGSVSMHQQQYTFNEVMIGVAGSLMMIASTLGLMIYDRLRR
jgi:hypothetical protein